MGVRLNRYFEEIDLPHFFISEFVQTEDKLVE